MVELHRVEITLLSFSINGLSLCLIDSSDLKSTQFMCSYTSRSLQVLDVPQAPNPKGKGVVPSYWERCGARARVAKVSLVVVC